MRPIYSDILLILIVRQLSGGNYEIAVEQVLCGIKLQRLKLYHRIQNMQDVSHNDDECCCSQFSQEELWAMDSAILAVSDISPSENATLCYIAGYVAHKCSKSGQSNFQLNTASTDPFTISSASVTDSAEFLILVSRGKLCIPSDELFQFSRYCYVLFETLTGSQNCHFALRLRRLFLFFMILFPSPFLR